MKDTYNCPGYFKCKCPPDLKSGKDGLAHLVPIYCLTTKREIAEERKRRKNIPRGALFPGYLDEKDLKKRERKSDER